MKEALTEMRHMGAFRGDVNVLYSGCDDSYKDMHIFQNFLSTYFKWVQYITFYHSICFIFYCM